MVVDSLLMLMSLETHLRPRGQDGTQSGAESGTFGDVGGWEEGQRGEGEEEMIHRLGVEGISVQGHTIYLVLGSVSSHL